MMLSVLSKENPYISYSLLTLLEAAFNHYPWHDGFDWLKNEFHPNHGKPEYDDIHIC
jgi:hypothetical protein